MTNHRILPVVGCWMLMGACGSPASRKTLPAQRHEATVRVRAWARAQKVRATARPAAARPAPPPRRARKYRRPKAVSRAQWKQWQQRFPALKRYRLLSLDPFPVKKLLAWIPVGGSGSVYDRRCRRIRVSRTTDSLYGTRVTSRRIRRKTLEVQSDEYTFDSTILLTDGGTEFYERRRRRWVKTGGAVHGCARSVGHFLSRVTSTAAYYDAVLVALYPVCGSFEVRIEHCRQGGTRRCRRCRSWDVGMRSLTARVGYGRGRAPVVTIGPASGSGYTPPRVDCSKPCPGSNKAEAVATLRRFLKGRRFINATGNDHPYLFRSRRACRRYRRSKRIPKDDLDVW